MAPAANLSASEQEFLVRRYTEYLRDVGSVVGRESSMVAFLQYVNIDRSTATTVVRQAMAEGLAPTEEHYLVDVDMALKLVGRCKTLFESLHEGRHPDESDAEAAVDSLRMFALNAVPQPPPQPRDAGAPQAPRPAAPATRQLSRSDIASAAEMMLSLDSSVVERILRDEEGATGAGTSENEAAPPSHRSLLPATVPAKVVLAMRRLGGYYDEDLEMWMIDMANVAAARVTIPAEFLFAESLSMTDSLNERQFYRLLTWKGVSAPSAGGAKAVGGTPLRGGTSPPEPGSPVPDATLMPVKRTASSVVRDRSIAEALQDLDIDKSTQPVDPSEAILARVQVASDLHERRLSPLRQARPLKGNHALPTAILSADGSRHPSSKPTLSLCFEEVKPSSGNSPQRPSTANARTPSLRRPVSGSGRAKAPSATTRNRPSYTYFPTLSGSFLPRGTLSSSSNGANFASSGNSPTRPPLNHSAGGGASPVDEATPMSRVAGREVLRVSSASSNFSRPSSPTVPAGSGHARIVYLVNDAGERVKHFLIRAASPQNPPTVVRPTSRGTSSIVGSRSISPTVMQRLPTPSDGKEALTNRLRDDDETIADDDLVEEMRERRAAKFIQTRMRVWISSLKSRTSATIQRIGRAFLARKRVAMIPVAIRVAGDKLVRTKRAVALLLRIQRFGRGYSDRKALGDHFAGFSERRSINAFAFECGITRVGISTILPSTESFAKLALRCKRRALPSEDSRMVIEDEFAEDIRLGDDEEVLAWGSVSQETVTTSTQPTLVAISVHS